MINQDTYNLTQKAINLIYKQLNKQFNAPTAKYHREQNYIDQPQSIEQLCVSFPPYLTLKIFNDYNQSNLIKEYNKSKNNIRSDLYNYDTSKELKDILNNYVDQL